MVAAAALSLIAWLWLLLARGGYWRARERSDGPAPADRPVPWPAVAAVIPARNEADVIGRALGSVLGQDYPGPFHVVLVDDHSEDGTGDAARRAASSTGRGESLSVIGARPLPPDWSGKLWAISEGMDEAGQRLPAASYWWLTDADIAHDPDTLRWLVAKAEGDARALVSFMARLHCAGVWERLLIPPFVLFFQKLYPFAWVNDPTRHAAAAAGGCILVRRDAFEAAGGLAPIRGALIDDCALAKEIDTVARSQDFGIWLGLTERSRSLRPYDGLDGIWRMVARTAYTQLDHSPWQLLGTVAAMLLVYVVPPLAVLTAPLHGSPWAALAGLPAWGVMGATAWPILRFYRQPAWLAPLLPLAALLYTAMTVDSARQHRQGRGGRWKGRVQGTTRRRPAA